MVIKLKSQWETERPFNLLSWGHWFTFANLLLALFFSVFYFSSEHLPSSFIGWLYLTATWLGHFAFLSMACFILTIFPVVVLFPYKRHIRGVSAVMASLFQLYLFLDVLAYRGLGYHLTSSSFSQIREVEDVYVSTMGEGYFLMVLAVFIAILAYQFVASNMTWKRIHKLQKFKYRYKVSGTLIGCFVAGHLLHLWGDATLNSDIAKTQSVFPAHYPLTAKTLLAQYDLIDLEDYQKSVNDQANVEKSSINIRPTSKVSCDINDKPDLDIFLIPLKSFDQIQSWLTKSNIRFESSNNLAINNNLNTLVFNINSGLPAIYQNTPQIFTINKVLGAHKIKIQIVSEGVEFKNKFDVPTDHRAFIFYDVEESRVFYRAKSLLVGFKSMPDVAFAPQNIIASYLSDGLACSEYVDKNLVDVPFSRMTNDHISAQYAEEHFYFVYKDNALLYKKGQLVSNETFSSGKPIKDSVDIYAIKRAIAKLTKLRSDL
jgi:uncharacterized protein